jgi:hypothetical protein
VSRARGAGRLLTPPSWPPRVSRAPRWTVPVLFIVLLVAFAAGIWGSYREVFPGRGLYRVTGIFEERWGETLILVRHEAIHGLMDEMNSMAFLAESKELLDRAALRRGDHVRFTIRQFPEKLLVVEIHKIRSPGGLAPAASSRPPE